MKKSMQNAMIVRSPKCSFTPLRRKQTPAIRQSQPHTTPRSQHLNPGLVQTRMVAVREWECGMAKSEPIFNDIMMEGIWDLKFNWLSVPQFWSIDALRSLASLPELCRVEGCDEKHMFVGAREILAHGPWRVQKLPVTRCR
ncbi:predicted protein [Histoplasma capsulatum H143]|uniref:Uncharacterized protein n=1 Tax=Ajellomyces capsulatus (strain H143) TaxID=544712 RepID=C6HLH4_AJECH|nr:predicted protein [Histoplasma capsulatum H143]